MTIFLRSALIIFNITAMSLAILGTTCLVLLPDEKYPGGWLWWHLIIYNFVFIIITNFGIFGSYLMCESLLWPYSISMLVIIGLNFITWIFLPERSLMDMPFDIILITSLFDITAMVCSFYLIYKIKKQRNLSKITPVKQINNVESNFETITNSTKLLKE